MLEHLLQKHVSNLRILHHMLSCMTCIGTELPATLGFAPEPLPPSAAAQEGPTVLPPRSLPRLRLPRALPPDPEPSPSPALPTPAAGKRTPARPSASAMPAAGCAAAATASSCAATGGLALIFKPQPPHPCSWHGLICVHIE